MSEENQAQKHPNKVKVYAAAFGIYLLVNFAAETGITLLENATQQWLYPIFPFTRLYLLIITILLANYYIRRKQGKPKQKLWWRILKATILLVLGWLFFFGAWFSMSEAELERMRQNRPEVPSLQVPTKIELDTTYEIN